MKWQTCIHFNIFKGVKMASKPIQHHFYCKCPNAIHEHGHWNKARGWLSPFSEKLGQGWMLMTSSPYNLSNLLVFAQNEAEMKWNGTYLVALLPFFVTRCVWQAISGKPPEKVKKKAGEGFCMERTRVKYRQGMCRHSRCLAALNEICKLCRATMTFSLL